MLQSILLCDFYKAVHKDMYDPSITRLVSYYTPRKSRFKDIQEIPIVGLQKFIIKYLINDFNDNFFNIPLKEIVKQYTDVISQTMGNDRISVDKIIQLHNLGYLPLEINAIEEGICCPMGIPMIEITNTHPKFAWCVNVIESLLSSEMWYQSCTAIAGKRYRDIVNEYYEKTVTDKTKTKSAISEFGFRGLPGMDAAMKASMGFLLSFNKTATIPAIYDIHEYYGDALSEIGGGMASTEHSIMTSSFALDDDEDTLFKRLITEVYSTGNLSIVCDSYDYWRVIKEVVPKYKDEILNRKGVIFFRGDSGDPVEIVTETVFELYEIFGGYTNNKGYTVLNNHVRAIYGDAITQVRAKQIYQILKENGFSAENVALGAGSFSMLCYMDENGLNPYTRDSFSVAIKTTYAETATSCIDVFKDPITDTDKFKKSQKGCTVVFKENGEICYEDGHTYSDARAYDDNLLKPLFKNGKLLRTTTFNEVRQRFWNGKF